ncbi:TIGR02301 family protein [Pelagibacterium luteolum]|uniref:TIGR02301 family protein n=1 Tax=Pelagibacterium luteolum TaxID=440168 RepID=A0A1G7TVA5_9HYPH|nr:TIGR02301 family protein [Pelagibacterium luteolum]SDG39192.1 TIGR02301 family protein [Pelagibacterium luteolum]
MRILRTIVAVAVLGLAPAQAMAIDPPYQQAMQRLSEILGSLYMLAPLCGDVSTDWRSQMADLIALDEPDADRRARLSGAFNAGYEAYARFHRTCTPSAETAINRLLIEGEGLARDIHQRYAE